MNIFFIIVIVGSLGIWLYLFKSLKKSFDLSPIIFREPHISIYKNPFVSIIIPARNEEKHIANCINSILNQSYGNCEIIVVDDSSTDNTWKILQTFGNDPRLKVLRAPEKPPHWVGKNWPCYQGYKVAKGDYLLFTDADTIHSRNSVNNSLGMIIMEKLDVLTVVPNLLYPSFIIKMVLPILSIFMFSQYSPLRVNNPKVKLGYLFGSFFLISKSAYEKIGTHQSVKEEIVEDGALGKKLKEGGYKLKMFRGEGLVKAYWARDLLSLWYSLKRLIVPIYFTNKKNSLILTIGVFALMAFPFVMLVYSTVLYVLYNDSAVVEMFLLVLSGICVGSIHLTNYYQLRKAKTHSSLYFLGSTIGCLMVPFAFIYSIVSSVDKGVIKWRDRTYLFNKQSM
ncbi:MAG: glycosyltransferase [Thermoproteota archaeon]|nr:glycosyltransferase [Thermoproteota archaeon]